MQNCLNFGAFWGILGGKEKVFENPLKLSQSFENPRRRSSNVVCSCCSRTFDGILTGRVRRALL